LHCRLYWRVRAGDVLVHDAWVNASLQMLIQCNRQWASGTVLAPVSSFISAPSHHSPGPKPNWWPEWHHRPDAPTLAGPLHTVHRCRVSIIQVEITAHSLLPPSSNSH